MASCERRMLANVLWTGCSCRVGLQWSMEKPYSCVWLVCTHIAEAEQSQAEGQTWACNAYLEA